VRDPEVLLFVKGKKQTHIFNREPSAITISYKNNFLDKTGWPDINYGEDIHVYDPFIRGGHVRYFFVDDYAIQLKGGIILRVINSIINHEQLFMSGFGLGGYLFY
ncbi:MAG: hypothetical protein NC827_09590, partial [Candidatus Omnitrophica bacterium]|nr:hypothetical protein [Candidatus Omnitrophota bacterium]